MNTRNMMLQLPKEVMTAQLLFLLAFCIEIIEFFTMAGMFTAPLTALITIIAGLIAASISFVYKKSYFSIFNLIIVVTIYLIIFIIMPS